MVGAENYNSKNQVIFKSIYGDLFKWIYNDSWGLIDAYSVSGDDINSAESGFGQDFNDDGIIGNPYISIESVGNTSLYKNSSG